MSGPPGAWRGRDGGGYGSSVQPPVPGPPPPPPSVRPVGYPGAHNPYGLYPSPYPAAPYPYGPHPSPYGGGYPPPQRPRYGLPRPTAVAPVAGTPFGVVLVEVAFSWPGIGRYAVESMMVADLAPVQAVVLLTAIATMLINILVDVSYFWIDPRIEVSSLSEPEQEPKPEPPAPR